ncbi:AlbA family DNA-binding domain-containing protein [Paenibacillus polymyxa]|uniref:AlbA family DNA-binding domain-containing protein n=1 Tax=Paenibacillus TaxID=44249 RepID=UPI00069C11F8|nr:ATP-binding protein [Paenibacillus polymyxa]MCV9948548.1 ATP-binding protein [Paenibacillus sp. BT-177]MEB4782799.1 ATP-binding protein [Paenibacillus jamilae]SEJ56511.1 Putative DNA-binding domain-containing protein [Paenibacillus polymyxa]
MFSKEDIVKMINSEENKEIEFKESISGLKAEDIVAFANSKSGGVILIGVRDGAASDGRQIGSIIGCKVNDSARLTILDKAQSCRPAVNLNITSHGIDGKNIYVIEIPGGEYKPYCTEGGTYRIRADGRKRSLYPNELLSLFMESEREKFIMSFKDATTSIETQLEKTRTIIVEETSKMASTLTNFEETVYPTLDSIESSASSAESSSDNVENAITSIENNIKDIWSVLSLSLHILPSIRSKLDKEHNKDSLELIVTEITEKYLHKYIDNEESLTDKKIKDHIFFLRILFPSLSEKVIIDVWNRSLKKIIGSR